jgi:glutaredoxin
MQTAAVDTTELFELWLAAPSATDLRKLPLSTDPHTSVINARLGTLALLAAGIMSVLIFADHWTDIVLPLPAIWYRSRSMHLLLCIGLYLLAWYLLRYSSDNNQPTESAAVSGPLFRSLRMYSKNDCELCDRAAETLALYADAFPDLEVIYIDDNPELMQLHGQSVPVIEIDGQIRFRGIISDALLQRMIDARQRQLIVQPASHDESARNDSLLDEAS